MKGRLQFKYDEHLYLSKADIVNHIQSKVQIEKDKYALFAEPIVFKYGEDNTSPNIVLAIGAYGNGTDTSLDNKYFLIDSAQMEKDIEELKNAVTGHSEEIQEIEKILSNTIESIGLTEKGEIDKHEESHHIYDKKYLKDCEDILFMLVNLNNAIVEEETIRENTDTIIANNLEKEINDRAAADEAEATARIQGDIDDRNFAYNLYNEKIDNAVKVENIDEKNKEISLKIREGELILSQDTYGLSTNLSIHFDENRKYIQIKGINGQIISEISATPFIKDGFLDSAKIIKNEEEQALVDPDGIGLGLSFPYILLIWKTDAGKEPIRIEIKELIQTYKAGNGLELNNDIFSIKLDATCEPYLTVSENGLKLTGINAAIEAAKKSATTKIEKNIHASHLTLDSREEADGSKTYILDEDNIASDNDLQEFKTTIRTELSSAISDLDSKITTETEEKIAQEAVNRENADSALDTKIVAEEEARTVNDNVLKNMIILEENARINGDNEIKRIIGNGFEDKTITSAIIENRTDIEKMEDKVGGGFEDTTITDVLDKTAKKLETTYSALTATTENVNFLKNKVGEGLEGGETLTTAAEMAKADINSLKESVSDISSSLSEKVDKVEGSSLMTSEEHTKLSNIKEGADVNKIEIIKRNNKIVEISSDKSVNIEVPFEKIADAEKQLILEDGVLSSVFEVEYDDTKNIIYFYGKNRTELGTLDASKFVTEGFLKDVKITVVDGIKYLIFEFIKSDGTTKEVRVKLTDLVTEYTVAEDSKPYLKIENFEIGVKTNTLDRTGLATEVNLHDLDDKYATKTHEMEDIVGEGFSGETITHRVITVEDTLQDLIDSDMKLKNNLRVAGIYGILGTGVYKNGDTIPAGTSLMTIIKNILQKELWPLAVLPTVDLSFTNDKLSYEVGSTVTPSFKSEYTDGKYTYENGTTRWAITEPDSYEIYRMNSDGTQTLVATSPVGTLPQLLIEDDTNYRIMSIVHHKAGQNAVTNLGNDAPDATIPAANIISNAGTIKGYRSFFFGALPDEIEVPEEGSGIIDWSETARTYLDMSEEAPEEILIPNGTGKIIIAIPGNSIKSISRIFDSKTGFDITDSFTPIKNTIQIGGANSFDPIFYNVYVADPYTEISGRKFFILYK